MSGVPANTLRRRPAVANVPAPIEEPAFNLEEVRPFVAIQSNLGNAAVAGSTLHGPSQDMANPLPLQAAYGNAALSTAIGERDPRPVAEPPNGSLLLEPSPAHRTLNRAYPVYCQS